MAKKESSFLNMVFTLLFVTLIASTSLGYVYEITKGPKAKADLEKKLKAIKEVVPEFNNNPDTEKYEFDIDGGQVIFYPAKMNGKLVGTAVESFTSTGFSGDIHIIIGLLPDGTIYDTTVIEHKETPGLGDKIDKRKSDFSLQFKGKNPQRFKLSIKKDGGNVDGITAATYSSRAYCEAIQRAYDVYQKAGVK